ncbi:MAG: hypothetical protein M3355_12155 [Actinomycetota bacterium]|nr:hypothetical protein [Actinomycetota bacterium]
MGLVARTRSLDNWLVDLIGDDRLRFAPVALARERRGWHEGFNTVQSFIAGAPNWAHATTGAPVGYLIDSLGHVHLRGHLTGDGSTIYSTTEVFQLPTGYEPEYTTDFDCTGLRGNGDRYLVEMTVNGLDSATPGRVLCRLSQHPWDYVALDGIEYPSVGASLGR